MLRVAVVFFLLCTGVVADSLVVTSTANVEDNYRASGAANTNYGTGTTLRLTYNGLNGATMRPVIRVHGVDTLMSGVYADAIDSAFLRLNVVAANACGTRANYAGWRVLKPFYETMMTEAHWKDSAGTAADSGFSGTTGDSVDNRGDHARPDRWTTSIGTITGVASGWVSLNITTLARQWLGDTVAENGILFWLTTSPCGDNEGMDTVSFNSSECGCGTEPRFVFYYTPSAPPAVTEPPRYRQGPAGAEVRQGPTGASKRTGP